MERRQTMKIDLNRFTNADLAQLIREASTLLADRLDESAQTLRRPAPRSVVVVDEPPQDQKDFCLFVKGLLRSGQYVKAAERQRVAEIAETYGPWVRKQGLPTASNTGPWRSAGQFHRQQRPPEL